MNIGAEAWGYYNLGPKAPYSDPPRGRAVPTFLLRSAAWLSSRLQCQPPGQLGGGWCGSACAQPSPNKGPQQAKDSMLCGRAAGQVASLPFFHSVALSAFALLCSHPHCPPTELFSLCKTAALYLSHVDAPLPQTLMTTVLFPVFILRLAHLGEHNVLKVHPPCGVRQNSLPF